MNGGFDSALDGKPNKANWAEAVFHVTGAKPATTAAPTTPSRWVLGEGLTTEWPVGKDQRLPHADFIEQGGLQRRTGGALPGRWQPRPVDETQRGLAIPAQRQKRHVRRRHPPL